MKNRGSDGNRTLKCLVTAVLAAWMIGSGCAGVVAGSSPSGSKSAPVAPPTNTPQPQLAATPTSASFPAVAMGSSNSQTITLQNGGGGRLTIFTANGTGAGFGISVLPLPMSIPAGPDPRVKWGFAPDL